MLSNKLAKQALGLPEPRYVKKTKLDGDVARVYIDFKKGAKFVDEETGEKYGVERTRERVVKHLFLRQYETYLHIRMPSIKTKDGSIKVVKFPLCDKNTSFTYLFEAQVIELAKDMPRYKVAKRMKISDKTVFRIIDKYVKKSRKEADYNNVRIGGIDETSSKKGHKYITSFVDIEAGKVCTVVPGKGKDTLRKIKIDLENHGCDTEEIKSLTMDFSRSFIAGAKEYFPSASIVFDKFHLMQIMSKTIDKIRIKEAKRSKGLRGTRYLWLWGGDKLGASQKEKLDKLKKEHKALGEAYRLKENLKLFFEIKDYRKAEEYLDLRCQLAIDSKIPSIIKVVKTIRRHKYGIMEYIKRRLTNAILEGLNSIIQTLKKVARGFRNIDNFITMIYLKLGNFEIKLPN